MRGIRRTQQAASLRKAISFVKDCDVLDRLHEKRLSGDLKSKTKTVVLSNDAAKESGRLLEKYFASTEREILSGGKPDFSFTPGFSPVLSRSMIAGNRFNGFNLPQGEE